MNRDKSNAFPLLNRQTRGLSLPGMNRTLRAFVDEFTAHGFTTTARALTLQQIRQRIGPTELARITRLAPMDEYEELELVLGHYCIAWGQKGYGGAEAEGGKSARGTIDMLKEDTLPSWWAPGS
jgi:hypothetical protein